MLSLPKGFGLLSGSLGGGWSVLSGTPGTDRLLGNTPTDDLAISVFSREGVTPIVGDLAKSAAPHQPGYDRPVQNGQCGHYDNTDDHTLISDSTDFDITDNLTVMFWAKGDDAAVAADEYVVAKYDLTGDKREWAAVIKNVSTVGYFSILFGDPSDGTFEGEWRADTPQSINVWRHYAFTFTGGTVQLYIDGVAVDGSLTAGTGIPATLNNEDADLTIGSGLDSGSAAFFYDGQVFDVRMYDTTILTAAQILDISTNKTILTTNLVGMWKIDEQAGTTAYDSSGNGNDGTQTGITPSTFYAPQDVYSFQNNVGYSDGGSGVFIPRDESSVLLDATGGALDYTGKAPMDVPLEGSNCLTGDGTDDCVNSSTTVTAYPYSMCAWVITSTSTGVVTFLGDSSVDNNYSRMYLSSGKISALSRSGIPQTEAISTTSVDDGIPHHVAAVYASATSRKIYVDGVLENTDTTSITPTGIDVFEAFRSGDSTPALYFTGQIFDARLYDVELTDDQVTSIFETGDTSVAADTHWPFAEDAGITAYDVSGNDNHGTLTNFTLAAAWGTTQDVYHYNITKGFSLYEHASTDDMYVPYGADGNALSITPQTGYTKTRDNPSGAWHNGAETTLDFLNLVGGTSDPPIIANAAVTPNSAWNLTDISLINSGTLTINLYYQVIKGTVDGHTIGEIFESDGTETPDASNYVVLLDQSFFYRITLSSDVPTKADRMYFYESLQTGAELVSLSERTTPIHL